MIRNLAILAHVDAGKTTLSERILFMAGEVSHPGDVDDGLATLDYLPEEKSKGITIEAGISTYYWKEHQYNLIDTPGHIDFGIEVDLALAAVDGAVLVISGTGGVETQTVSAWKKLKERGVVTAIFVNKLDHPDSSLDDLLMDIEEKLNVRPLLLNIPLSKQCNNGMLDVLSRVVIEHDDQGKESKIVKISESSTRLDRLYNEVCEAASNVDDNILESVLNGNIISSEALTDALKTLFAKGEFVPCFCGSAKMCRGVRQLMTSFNLYFPQPVTTDEHLLGTVIRLRHCRDGSEYALFKSGANLPESVWPESFRFFRIAAEMLSPVQEIKHNDVYALVAGDRKFDLGDIIGRSGELKGRSAEIEHVADLKYQPLLHAKIECAHLDDWTTIDNGLRNMLRSDPSMRVQADPETGGWAVKTMGEVQLEVLVNRLNRELQCEVIAGTPEVIYYERLKKHRVTKRNSFNSTDGLELQIQISLEAIDGIVCEVVSSTALSSPLSPREADLVQDTFLEFCESGITGKGSLQGVRMLIEDAKIPENCPGAWVRKVFMDALILMNLEESVEILEPIMLMELDTPPDFAGNIIGDLQGRGGKVKEINGDGKFVKIFIEIPLKKVFGYSTIGRSISKGTASYALRFIGYRSVESRLGQLVS